MRILAVIGALAIIVAIGAAVFFLFHAFFTIGLVHWIVLILMGGLTMYLQLNIYKRILK